MDAPNLYLIFRVQQCDYKGDSITSEGFGYAAFQEGRSDQLPMVLVGTPSAEGIEAALGETAYMVADDQIGYLRQKRLPLQFPIATSFEKPYDRVIEINRETGLCSEQKVILLSLQEQEVFARRLRKSLVELCLPGGNK